MCEKTEASNTNTVRIKIVGVGGGGKNAGVECSVIQYGSGSES